MHIGRGYGVVHTLGWSRSLILIPLAWSAVLTSLHELPPARQPSESILY